MELQLEARINGDDWFPVEFSPFSGLHALLRWFPTIILIDSDNNLVEYRRIDL